jgi:hypothetical protein
MTAGRLSCGERELSGWVPPVTPSVHPSSIEA